MPAHALGARAVSKIHAAVEALFDRAKARFLGRRPPKEIRIGIRTPPVGVRDDLTLGGVFDHSAQSEGFKPSENLRESLNRVASGYLDAHKELAKVKAVNAVHNWLQEAAAKKTKTDVDTVLGGELTDLMREVTANVKKIAEAETNRAKNSGTIDGIAKIAAVTGQDDPLVYFVIVRDGHVCDECLRLHQVTGTISGPPKVYKLSEVGHGYHKKGQENPKVTGLHPHCRCSLVYIGKGFGFNDEGKLTYISNDHDEWSAQRDQG
jgi:uncharacterized protein YqgV (UPF0045/DUF77 family)